jgi:predicted transcriptional regulator
MTEDAFPFLADSPVRPRLLGALDRMGASRPRDLVDELDVSRATVHRNLSALSERGWVRQDSDGYVATTAGVLVHDRFRGFREGVDTVERFEPLLEVVPYDAVPPLSTLAAAELVTATPDKPHAPVMRYVEELTAAETSTVWGASPVRSEMFDHGHEQLLEVGVETELVMPVDVVERDREEDPDAFAETLDIEDFSMYVTDDQFGFGLSVTDDRAFLGGYGADNQLQALAVSTDDAFVSWAQDRFERLRDDAQPVLGRRAEVDTQSGRN